MTKDTLFWRKRDESRDFEFATDTALVFDDTLIRAEATKTAAIRAFVLSSIVEAIDFSLITLKKIDTYFKKPFSRKSHKLNKIGATGYSLESPRLCT